MAIAPGDMQSIGTLGMWVTVGALPSSPDLAVVDREDGTGADAAVSNSDAGTTNRVYTGDGVTGWTLRGNVVGDGSVALDLSIGSYWAKVESTGTGGTVCGDVVPFIVTSGNPTGQYRVIQILRPPGAKHKVLRMEKIEQPIVPK